MHVQITEESDFYCLQEPRLVELVNSFSRGLIGRLVEGILKWCLSIEAAEATADLHSLVRSQTGISRTEEAFNQRSSCGAYLGGDWVFFD